MKIPVKTVYINVDSYIASFPPEVKKLLTKIRKLIKEAAPEAQEVISYNMPAYKQNGMVAYFAAHTHHIGFYPTASPIVQFQDKLTAYHTSKGGVKLPMNKALPKKLIQEMIRFKINENREKASRKKKTTVKPKGK